MFSSCDKARECVRQRPHSSRLPCGECAEALHDISNIMTAVLVNARILGWKLPPYSHLKRPVHELERNAQRGGELLKVLARRLGSGDAQPGGPVEWHSDAMASGALLTARARRSNQAMRRSSPAPRSPVASAPGFLPQHSPDLTVRCDACPSGIFPKGDDGDER